MFSKITFSVMIIYRAYEQMTPIYDNISDAGKRKYSKDMYIILNLVSNIANSFWKTAILKLTAERHNNWSETE